MVRWLIIIILIATLVMLGLIYNRTSRILAMMEAETAAWEAEEARAVELYVRQERKITEYLKQHGSLYAQDIARAVMATKNPPLMAAIALRESTGNPFAVGDAGQSRGAFQVQPKWWGKVSADVHKQARQAEKVLDTLLMKHNGNMSAALKAYNGGGRTYAVAVLTHARRMQ